jgi:subfamily B ATP-binding cassette protein MsbA
VEQNKLGQQVKDKQTNRVQSQSVFQRIKRLAPYFTTKAWMWWIAILATAIGGGMEFVIAYLLKPLLDAGFVDKTLSPWFFPLLLVALALTRSVMAFLGAMALAHISNDGMLKLRRDLFAHLLKVDFSVFATQSASAFSNTLVYEVQTGSQLLIQTILGFVRNSAAVLGLFIYLMWLNWQLTLVVLIVFPIVAWVVRTFSRKLYRLTQDSQLATDDLAYVVEENVLANRIVRLHHAERSQKDRFYHSAQVLRHISVKAAIAAAATSPLTHFFISSALAGVIALALYQGQVSDFTVGGFASFIAAMLMLVDPIKSLSQALHPLTRGLAALERGMFFIGNTHTESGGEYTQDQVRGEVRFEGVTVRYPHTENKALDHIDLSVKPGEIIALVGSSGSGKTTLVHLLPRFVLPSQGTVYLDGKSIKDWDLLNLRQHIALVSQDIIMFNDSLIANVALGAVINETRVKACLQAANLMDYVDTLPQGMHTVVGHNAMQLSGGQRQRLAIARALYKDAPILLLDEATSALDNESERLIQDALEKLMQGRTTFIVAHRLSTTLCADRIVVMQRGKIVEQGQHSELLNKGGYYTRLYN